MATHNDGIDALMLQLLLILSLAAVTCYVMVYRKASRLVAAQFGQADAPAWHARPAHFALYGFGKSLLLAACLVIGWWVLRAPLLEFLVGSVAGINVPEDNAAFFLYEVRQALEMAVHTKLSAVQQAWVAQYQAYMSYGNKIIGALAVTISLYGAYKSYGAVHPDMQARRKNERFFRLLLKAAAYTSIAVTILIFFSVVFEAFLFFRQIPVHEFLFGTSWSPQMAIRADQAGASGSFGFIPLFIGTLLITFIALCVAVPIGLFAAIYMSEYATRRVRSIGKPVLEILAGIPTVVYGFFAVVTMAPFLRGIGDMIGLEVASESALAAGLVMGIMIIPLVSSLADDAIASVPHALRDASYGLGATQSETIRQVVLPAALPGIMGGVLLATSRAIGETMIVVMAAGLSANLTINPLESVTTITVQIVALLVGDQEFGSTKTLAAFALGLTLFLFTLALNVLALHTVRRYREAYE